MHIIQLIWMLTVNLALYSPFYLKTSVRVQSQHQEMATLYKYCMTNSKYSITTQDKAQNLSLFFLGGAGGGGGDRPADIKDVLDLENLRLSDHTNKASKTQVTV